MKKYFLAVVWVIAVLNCIERRESQAAEAGRETAEAKAALDGPELRALLANPLFVKIHTEADHFNEEIKKEAGSVVKNIEVSGTILDQIKERVNAAFKTKKADTGTWSAHQGVMNWNDAKEECESMGMRLPTGNELSAARESGVTESWEPARYWSSTEFSDARAYFMSIHDGLSQISKDEELSVRCIR